MVVWGESSLPPPPHTLSLPNCSQQQLYNRPPGASYKILTLGVTAIVEHNAQLNSLLPKKEDITVYINIVLVIQSHNASETKESFVSTTNALLVEIRNEISKLANATTVKLKRF